MRIENCSRRAREKFADHLFSISAGLVNGMTAVLLLGPMGLLLGAMFGVRPGVSPVQALMRLPAEVSGFFVALYLSGIYLIVHARSRAMKIYTELYPDAD